MWENTPTRQAVHNNAHNSEEERNNNEKDTIEGGKEGSNPEKMNHSARDDEMEFKRIPIAGEDSEDYHSDDMYFSGEETSEDGEIKEDRKMIPIN